MGGELSDVVLAASPIKATDFFGNCELVVSEERRRLATDYRYGGKQWVDAPVSVRIFGVRSEHGGPIVHVVRCDDQGNETYESMMVWDGEQLYAVKTRDRRLSAECDRFGLAHRTMFLRIHRALAYEPPATWSPGRDVADEPPLF